MASLDEDEHREANPTGIQGHIVDSAQPPGEETLTASTPEATGMQDLRSRYQHQGYSRRAADLLLNSLRPSTQKVYNTYIHKCKYYARLNNIDNLSPLEVEVANFLAHWIKVLAIVRSMLPGVRCQPDDDVGLHVLGCRVDILGTNCKKP